MKKVIMTLIMAVSIAMVGNAQEVVTPPANPNGPEITLDTEVIDYGTIDQGADGVRVFKIKNTGKEPLIISNAQGSCGCTTPEWPKEPIRPGETKDMKVKYDTQRVGNFEKTVTITSNAKTPSKVVKIKGVVKAGNATTPPSDAPAGTVAPKQTNSPK